MMKPPSLWLPEEDAINLAVIGKLGEEAAELAKACFRITIQGVDGNDPETGKPNLQALQEEIADVRGLSSVCIEHFDMDEIKIIERASMKRNHKLNWFDMIRDFLRGSHDQD